MRLRSTFQFLLLTAFSFTLINSVKLQLPIEGFETALDTSNVADARSSGGRSSGGSFSRSSSSSSSSRSSSSTPSRSSSSSSSRSSFGSSSTTIDTNRGNTGGRVQGGSFQRSSTPSFSSPQTSNPRTTPYNSGVSTTQDSRVITPIPANPPGYTPYQTAPQQAVPNSAAPTAPSKATSSDDLSPLDWLILVGLAEGFFALSSQGIMLLALLIWAVSKAATSGTASVKNELENDTVTVSKVQVALMAQARTIQSQLSDLTLNGDTQTSEGLAQLLQESALALLRSPEYWTHVSTSSQSVRTREEAETVFNQLSVQERSKFNVEALAHVNGKITKRSPILADSTESADYIVVTLLVGTEYDKPLFGEIRTTEALKQALERMAAIPAEHLLVFELLWSPQAEADSLTYDELLTEYTDMIPIA